jgi:ubiquinone biosynthesis protein COQ9
MAARDLEVADSMGWRLFPGGINQVIQLWNEDTDKKMLSRLKRFKTEDMRVRDRVALAVKIRLELLDNYKAAAITTAKYLALPHHTPLGTKMMFKTVDEIWHWAGDESTDYNWYTKRGLLAGVYSSTLIYWMNDGSKEHAKTWAFLEKRIDNVMKLGVMPKTISECTKDLPHRISEIFRALKP